MTGLASGTLAAICGLAFALGLRHGMDADHLATIDGLARRNASRHPRLARFAGTLFSLGHGAVVVAVAAAASLVTSRWQTPPWLQISGAVVSVMFLFGLAFLNLRAVWTTPRHQVVTPTGLRSRFFERVGTGRPIVIVGVGMLFALSFDTVSQAALFAVAATRFGGVAQALLLAGCFVAGMLVTDGLNSLWIAQLIRRADRRAAAASRVMATGIGAVSLVIGAWILGQLIMPGLNVWSFGSGLSIGAAVIAATGFVFLAAMASAPDAAEEPHRTPAE